MSSAPQAPGLAGVRGQAPARGGPARTAGMSRAQRAAVVIYLMGDAAAKPIVEKFDDATMAQVAAALEQVSTLGREELAEIAIDFLKELRAKSGSFSGGRDKAREIVSGLLDQGRFDQIFGALPDEPEETVTGDAWARLEKQSPKKIAAYFEHLTPNIIALILRKLDVATGSDIVNYFDEEKLNAVIEHLVTDEMPDPEIYAVLAHMIEIEFLNSQSGTTVADDEEDDAHLESVGELLSLIPTDKRDRLVAFLNGAHEAKMKSIERVLFTIDGLPEMLPRNMVPIVFRELGEETMVRLLATLRKSGAAVSDHLLGNISSRLADQYRLQLSEVEQVSGEEIEQIQRAFLMSLMSMKRRGQIVMEKPVKQAS